MAWWGSKPNVATDIGRATAVVASAARLRYDSGSTLRRITKQAWQEEAWGHYEECGEFSFVVDLIAKAMSRARLYVTQVNDDGRPVESPDEAPEGVNDSLLGGPSKQAELLKEIGIQLGVPGECYLIGEVERSPDGTPTDRETWLIASVDELQERQGVYVIDPGDGPRELVPDETVIVRIWVPNPRKHALPRSQAQANLRVLRLIERLTQYVQSQIDSRLAGAGILMIPNELTFAAPESEANPEDGVSTFLAALTEAMTTAVKDRDSVAALVPIVVQGPAEHLEKARLLSFATELSASVPSMLDGAIRRLALGLDAPPEMLLGMSQANHWSAWMTDEATIKYHVESKLELVCAALTQQMLWPALEGVVDDPRLWVVWYDTSELTQTPDKGGDAKDLYGLGEISGEALRRETGFGNEDAPTDAERELRRLLDIIRAVPASGPHLIPRLLQVAGIDITLDPEILARTADPEPGPVEPAADDQPALEEPSSGDTEDRGPPEAAVTAASEPARTEALIAACEALVLRALETAGKRHLGRARYQHSALEPWELHTVRPAAKSQLGKLLTGAFATVPHVAERLGVDAQHLTMVLTAYVGGLLIAGARHDVDQLREHLSGRAVGELMPA
ncbi:hypothetical protein Ait01nite_020110 [Actinoplanes italicus]|uniref:Portal protein n=1 Tax=Actinoplanes italicus TaxID=113567 RepID=A0A2T0KPD4_9ACTN|nr:hypothetical protein [Actinoplanes italicus]PRX25590.1 hypothetical protein CLV67_101307 [Actinoplanes italicus]GIE28966.1 hypothetical protein Ait01nite_020110 [Actinoplanes italicus]